MIRYHQAITLLLERAARLPTQTLSLAEAMGTVAAEDVAAGFDVPSFNNSAMDGFAIRSGEIADCAAGNPITLPVQSLIAAGAGREKLQQRYAAQIMTGAMVPDGADAVVPIEDVEVIRNSSGKATNVIFRRFHPSGSHIRRRGEDFRTGDILCASGTRISAATIMAMSALGKDAIKIRKPPAIFVFATGDEIADAGIQLSSEGGIYNSNSPYLLAMARLAGMTCGYEGIISDKTESFQKRLLDFASVPKGCPRIILSTGAVSRGEYDFVPEMLSKIGARILFHRVGMRPGKPILCAVLPSGDFFFGLPGNPVSAAVGFRFFVMPLVRAMTGMEQEVPLRVPMISAWRVKAGLRQFLKAAVSCDCNGRLQGKILDGQESFMISPLLHANGWAAIPEDGTDLSAGMQADFYPADPFATESFGYREEEMLLCKTA